MLTISTMSIHCADRWSKTVRGKLDLYEHRFTYVCYSFLWPRLLQNILQWHHSQELFFSPCKLNVEPGEATICVSCGYGSAPPTTKKMISWDIAQLLTEAVTKSNHLLKYLRIFRGGHFIYASLSKCNYGGGLKLFVS